MKRPERKELEALASLRGNHYFEVILAWIASSREEQIEVMESANTDMALQQAAAYSRALRDILRHADEAPAALQGLMQLR